MTGENLPMPDGYADLLEDLKRTVATARWRAQRVVNTELVRMYWRIGRTILDRLESEAYGTSVINRLSHDLQAAFPDSRGFSPRNLRYMRTFAQSWPDEVWQQPAAELPWGHVMVLLDKLE
ncbi:MAG: DUF1016 family protein, partial [Opitutae bacterium]|nr:DUF1016 family protein [Opitutae bacterium]